MDATLIAPTPPYKALIFDCDGTLADTLPVHFQTWSASLKAVGADISQEWYYQYCGTSAMAEDCIVYEDSDGGLEAARRAGMRSIDVRVLWQYKTTE